MRVRTAAPYDCKFQITDSKSSHYRSANLEFGIVNLEFLSVGEDMLTRCSDSAYV